MFLLSFNNITHAEILSMKFMVSLKVTFEFVHGFEHAIGNPSMKILYFYNLVRWILERHKYFYSNCILSRTFFYMCRVNEYCHVEIQPICYKEHEFGLCITVKIVPLLD